MMNLNFSVLFYHHFNKCYKMRNIATINDLLLSTSSVPLLMKSMMRNPVISGFEDLEAGHVWWSGEGEGPPGHKVPDSQLPQPQPVVLLGEDERGLEARIPPPARCHAWLGHWPGAFDREERSGAPEHGRHAACHCQPSQL